MFFQLDIKIDDPDMVGMRSNGVGNMPISAASKEVDVFDKMAASLQRTSLNAFCCVKNSYFDKKSLKFVFKGLIYYKSWLVQIMAWCCQAFGLSHTYNAHC